MWEGRRESIAEEAGRGPRGPGAAAPVHRTSRPGTSGNREQRQWAALNPACCWGARQQLALLLWVEGAVHVSWEAQRQPEVCPQRRSIELHRVCSRRPALRTRSKLGLSCS